MLLTQYNGVIDMDFDKAIKTIKKVAAILTGIAMLGATITGALA